MYTHLSSGEYVHVCVLFACGSSMPINFSLCLVLLNAFILSQFLRFYTVAVVLLLHIGCVCMQLLWQHADTTRGVVFFLASSMLFRVQSIFMYV